MNKGNLRKIGKNHLLAVRENEKKKRHTEAVLNKQLFESPLWENSRIIATTHSFPFEFNTEGIILQAWKEGKQVVLPKTSKHRKMNFFLFTPEIKLYRTSFGVKEPDSKVSIKDQEIDLVIVPGLVFREDGYRIGFGGGYYDTFLAKYTGNSCALLFKEQVNNDWQPEIFDVPIQQLFIEKEGEKEG